jgi:hypothetical protein
VPCLFKYNSTNVFSSNAYLVTEERTQETPYNGRLITSRASPSLSPQLTKRRSLHRGIFVKQSRKRNVSIYSHVKPYTYISPHCRVNAYNSNLLDPIHPGNSISVTSSPHELGAMLLFVPKHSTNLSKGARSAVWLKNGHTQ